MLLLLLLLLVVGGEVGGGAGAQAPGLGRGLEDERGLERGETLSQGVHRGLEGLELLLTLGDGQLGRTGAATERGAGGYSRVVGESGGNGRRGTRDEWSHRRQHLTSRASTLESLPFKPSLSEAIAIFGRGPQCAHCH